MSSFHWYFHLCGLNVPVLFRGSRLYFITIFSTRHHLGTAPYLMIFMQSSMTASHRLAYVFGNLLNSDSVVDILCGDKFHFGVCNLLQNTYCRVHIACLSRAWVQNKWYTNHCCRPQISSFGCVLYLWCYTTLHDLIILSVFLFMQLYPL